MRNNEQEQKITKIGLHQQKIEMAPIKNDYFWINSRILLCIRFFCVLLFWVVLSWNVFDLAACYSSIFEHSGSQRSINLMSKCIAYNENWEMSDDPVECYCYINSACSSRRRRSRRRRRFHRNSKIECSISIRRWEWAFNFKINNNTKSSSTYKSWAE